MRIEFYGIPRQRAGIESIEVEASNLGAALAVAGERLPDFARTCLDGNRLRPGYLANISGRMFTTDPTMELQPEDTILVLSADAGG